MTQIAGYVPLAEAERDPYWNVDYDGKEKRQKLPSLETFTVDTLAGKPLPARQWHVEGLIPAGVPCTLNADGGLGKTILGLQLCVATAKDGGFWAGRPVKRGRAVYLSAEEDQDELHRRLFEIAAGAQVSLADLPDITVLPMAEKDALLAVPEAKTNVLKPTTLFAKVDELLSIVAPTLLVIDTLADTFGGVENDRAHARQFIGSLRGLCIRHAVTILLLAHPSLTGMASGSGSSGSTAWSNSVRARLFLDRVRCAEGDEPDPDLRVLRVVKSNYARLGEEIRLRWQAGTFVPATGQDSTTSAAMQYRAERVFLELVEVYAARGRYVSASPSASFAPAVFERDPKAEGIRKRGFLDAMNRLFEAGKIKVESVGPASRQVKRIVVVRPE